MLGLFLPLTLWWLIQKSNRTLSLDNFKQNIHLLFAQTVLKFDSSVRS
jgi:hypothetical protein